MTTSKRFLLPTLICLLASVFSCTQQESPLPPDEPEMLSRTEFTQRLENFFEYAPLKASRPSQFLIHLTDLSDGTPVEGAQVTLTAREQGKIEVAAQAIAQIGRVTGIYVAELAPPMPGSYDLEFHIQNPKLNERMPMSGFEVE